MWSFNRMCNSKAHLVGKTVIITGANTGIGKETARDFYKRGAKVILACRDIYKAKKAREDIEKSTTSRLGKDEFDSKLGELVIYPLNLCSLKSIKECAKNLLENESAIHILVNNAGVMMCPYEITEDGFELHLQSNYLGHFLLTLLLLPKMLTSAPDCRIVNVSSDIHIVGNIYFDDINLKESYNPLKGYAQSKMANILFSRELVRRLKEANIQHINVYCLHPGVVRTDLGRHLSNTIFPSATFFFQYILWPFIKTPEQGAQTTIHCSVDENAAKETGLYYSECQVRRPYKTLATNDEAAKKLWDYTCQLLHLETNNAFHEFLKTVSRQITK